MEDGHRRTECGEWREWRGSNPPRIIDYQGFNPDISHFRVPREGTRPTSKAASACSPRALTRHSVGR